METDPKGRSGEAGVSMVRPFRPVLDRLAYPIIILGTDLCAAYVNSAFEQLVGIPAQELMGVGPPFPFWGASEHEKVFKLCGNIPTDPASSASVREFSITFSHSSGQRLPMNVVYLALRDSEGELTGHFSLVNGDGESSADAARGEGGSDRAREERLEDGLSQVALILNRLGFSHWIPPSPIPLSDPGKRGLSPREWESLRHLLAGHRAPAIAGILGISPNTARNHLKSVFRKLGVSSQKELLEKLGAKRRG